MSEETFALQDILNQPDLELMQIHCLMLQDHLSLGFCKSNHLSTQDHLRNLNRLTNRRFSTVEGKCQVGRRGRGSYNDAWQQDQVTRNLPHTAYNKTCIIVIILTSRFNASYKKCLSSK